MAQFFLHFINFNLNKMSNNVVSQADDSNLDWLEKSVTEGHIKYYEYSDFKDIKSIGKGSFGNVDRVTWNITNRFFALKSFNNDKEILENVVKEV